jgi:hypothetical protein
MRSRQGSARAQTEWHTVKLSVFSTALLIGASVAILEVAGPQPAAASAQPSCSQTRVTRTGVLKMIYTQENGGYTSFASHGGGTYGVDPNSIPETLMNALKPNGPTMKATVAGRVCEDHIFYIERVLAPFRTAIRPYTP